MRSRTILGLILGTSVCLAVGACSKKPAADQTTDAATTTVATAAPIETAAPTAEPTAAPTATADATASAAPTSNLPPPSGRPPMVESKPESITGMFGATPAAKLELTKEGAFLRIPEYALGDGVTITFQIEKKPKKAKGGVGTEYRLIGLKPPSDQPVSVSTRGPAFSITMIVPKGGSTNLAIGEPSTDDKGKETINWKVVAATKVEAEKATFELTEFKAAYLQITSEGPTSPPAPNP
jgi:hypothetical protein